VLILFFELTSNYFIGYTPPRVEFVYAGGQQRQGGEMTVNVYTDAVGVNHFSFVYDLAKFSIDYACSRCHWLFSTRRALAKHRRNQPNCHEQKHLFPGCGAVLRPTLFERLEAAGICVDDEHRYYPFFAVFDWESCAEKIHHNETFTLLPRKECTIATDPREPPENVGAVVRRNWSRLRSRVYDRFAVIRSPCMVGL